MKIFEQIDESRSELSVVPLVNIVFLLLIFFMLVGQIASSDRIEVVPPSSNSGEADNTQPVLLLLASDGQVAVGDTLVPETNLISHLEHRIQENPELSFRIKADAKLDAQYLIEVMEKLRAVGVNDVSLLTELSE